MILSLLREALRAMAANRMRTFLTMLGLIIGVGAVILMLAIGQGASALVQQAIESLGSNLFIVYPGTASAGGVRTGSGGVSTLTVQDGQAIAELPSILGSAPIYASQAQIVYGGANWSVRVQGVTPPYFDVRGWRMEQGYPITEGDVRALARVAVLGQTVVRQLFDPGTEN